MSSEHTATSSSSTTAEKDNDSSTYTSTVVASFDERIASSTQLTNDIAAKQRSVNNGRGEQRKPNKSYSVTNKNHHHNTSYNIQNKVYILLYHFFLYIDIIIL